MPSRYRAALRRGVVTLCAMALAAEAGAHGLLLDAETDGQAITGRVYYTNGQIAVRESVALLDLSVAGSKSLPSRTDEDGRFSFSVTSTHRYRISAYGEEGHTVDVELEARASARPEFVETATTAKESSALPPAWAVIGLVLLASLVPVAISRRRAGRRTSASS